MAYLIHCFTMIISNDLDYSAPGVVLYLETGTASCLQGHSDGPRENPGRAVEKQGHTANAIP